jgi:hypothetical protein
MICTGPFLNSNLPKFDASMRRTLAGSIFALGTLCCAGMAFAAESSGDGTPSALNMSIIQGLAGSEPKKAAAAAPPAAPAQVPAAQPAAPAVQPPAPVAAKPPVPAPATPAVSAVPAAKPSQPVAVEMPSGKAQGPAAGSTAAAVEERLSAFDMNTIRGLVSPPGATPAATPAPTPGPLQSAQAPKMPAGNATPAPPKPAVGTPQPGAVQPLPDAQMELIRDVFSIEGAG